MCLAETEIICIDADFPVELQNILWVKEFEIDNQKTNLYFVERVLLHLKIFTRFTLKRGFFSCCFPNEEDLDKVLNYGIKPEERKIIGPEICQQYRPFDLAFLDGDHRKEAVEQDLILLSNYIRPGGRIVLHDMGLDYWGQEVRQGVKNFLKQHPQKEFRIEGEIGLISL